MGEFQADTQGHFEITAKIPPRPADEVQSIRAVTQENVGSPHLTQTAYDTWNKIIETVFLALLATTFGIMLAIPISFFAARNLMKDVTTTLSGLALSLIGWPVGIYIGAQFARRVGEFSATLTTSPGVDLASILISAAIIYLMLRWALPQEEQQAPSPGIRAIRLLLLLFAALLSVLLLFLITKLGVTVGDSLETNLGTFSFLGSFVFSLAQGFFESGGFDEKIYAGEEILFSRRISKWGRKHNLPFIILEDYPVITSARKFHWYSSLHLALLLLFFTIFPLALRSRSLCKFWYSRPGN